MRRAIPALLVIVALASPAAAGKPDKRLADVKKAFVVPIDDLNEDVPVAKCLADHVADMTPIQSVKTKEEADVIFRVKANIPSATSRVMLGAMGGSPSAHIYAELPDGTKLWDDGGKLRRAMGSFGQLKSSDGANTVYCGLADDLLDHLRDAMKNARDQKKK